MTLSNKEDPDYYEYLLIKDIFDESKGTYGYRRVLEGLKIKYGVIFNDKSNIIFTNWGCGHFIGQFLNFSIV